MAGDRPRALFFVLVLLSVLAFFYALHLRDEAARAARPAISSGHPFPALLALLAEPNNEPPQRRPAPASPQRIAVRLIEGELRALGPVRVNGTPHGEARFIFREEQGWLIVEKVSVGGKDLPCDGIMKRDARSLAIGRCGSATEKTAKEMTKNLINE